MPLIVIEKPMMKTEMSASDQLPDIPKVIIASKPRKDVK